MSPGEQVGYAIACDVLSSMDAADKGEDPSQLMIAGVVLALLQPDPAAAMVGFAQRMAPAFAQATQATGKKFYTLCARAELAGYNCTKDASRRIILTRRGRSMTFDDVAAATAWLDRVTARKGAV